VLRLKLNKASALRNLCRVLISIHIMCFVANLPDEAHAADKLSVKFNSVMLNITPEYREIVGSGQAASYTLISSYAVLVDTFPFNQGDIQVLDTGREWDIVKLNKYLFHLHYKAWEDSFLKVDAKKRKVYMVSGGRFGSGGGEERLLDGARFRKGGSTFEVYLPAPTLIYESGSRVLNVYFKDILIHTTGLRRVRKADNGSFMMAFRVAGYLAALDVNFRKQRIRTIKTEDVFAGNDYIPLLLEMPSDLYKYYPRQLGLTVTPGRKTFLLDGSSKEFGPSVQTSIDNYVLSYGQDWETVAPETDIYLLRYDEWEKDYFWKVNMKEPSLYEVMGGDFDSGGGNEIKMAGAAFHVYKGGNIGIKLPYGRLVFEPDADSMSVLVKDRIFQVSNILKAEKTGVDVYNITHRLASGNAFTWEIDFAMQTQKIVELPVVASNKDVPEHKRESKKTKKNLKDKVTWAGVVNDGEIYLGDLKFGIRKAVEKRENDYAVIIGNSRYSKTKDVDYALNDAAIMKKYLIDVLGFREANVFHLPNANKGDFETYFGTESNNRGKLFNNIVPGKSDVFIYYSGHGAPGLKDHRGYFVPVEAVPNYVELGGYPIDIFYENIEKLPANNITVVIDACFSGADIIERVSPITLEVASPVIRSDNIVVMSSSTGNQVSSWYDSQKHGLFTYFFIKALLDTSADANKDKKLTYNEIYKYVSDKTNGVPYYARKLNGIEQTPTIQGNNKDKVFITY